MKNKDEQFQIHQQPIKLTINIALLSLGTIIIHLLGITNIGFNFELIAEGEYQRMITSMFYTSGLFEIIEIIVLIFLLSLTREYQKCSFPFFIDLILKQIWLIGFSMLLYLLLILSSKIFESFFIQILEAQNKLVSNTLKFIFVSELAFMIFSRQQSQKRTNFFTRVSVLAWIPFLYLVISNFQNLLTYAAVIIGLLEVSGLLKFYTEIQNSRCNYILERGCWKVEKIFYFYYPTPDQNSVFSPHDNQMMRDSESSVFTKDEGKGKKEKHKYEDVNVEDFITRQNQSAIDVRNESFEI